MGCVCNGKGHRVQRSNATQNKASFFSLLILSIQLSHKVTTGNHGNKRLHTERAISNSFAKHKSKNAYMTYCCCIYDILLVYI